MSGEHIDSQEQDSGLSQSAENFVADLHKSVQTGVEKIGVLQKNGNEEKMYVELRTVKSESGQTFDHVLIITDGTETLTFKIPQNEMSPEILETLEKVLPGSFAGVTGWNADGTPKPAHNLRLSTLNDWRNFGDPGTDDRFDFAGEATMKTVTENGLDTLPDILMQYLQIPKSE